MNEIVRAWRGALRLARGDPAGMAYFDDTVEAFWRSFNAGAIVAPIYAVFAAAKYSAFPPVASNGRVLAAEMVMYVLSWVVYPALMLPICRAIGREAHYLRYIVAYNWAALVQMALYVALVFLAQLLQLSEGAADLLGDVALVLVLLYAWIIARIGLQVGPLIAAATVALSYGIGEATSAIVDWMVY